MFEYEIYETNGTAKDRENALKSYTKAGWRLHTIQRIVESNDSWYDLLTFEREVK